MLGSVRNLDDDEEPPVELEELRVWVTAAVMDNDGILDILDVDDIYILDIDDILDVDAVDGIIDMFIFPPY